jgi:hypothetical protein
MKNSIWVKTILISASLPLFAGCAERVVYRDRPAPANVVVEDPGPPPPLQTEVIPDNPDPAFFWIAGEWEWRGRWIWVHGHWGTRPRPDAVWVHGGWVRERHGHGHWVRGHWR